MCSIAWIEGFTKFQHFNNTLVDTQLYLNFAVEEEINFKVLHLIKQMALGHPIAGQYY